MDFSASSGRCGGGFFFFLVEWNISYLLLVALLGKKQLLGGELGVYGIAELSGSSVGTGWAN